MEKPTDNIQIEIPEKTRGKLEECLRELEITPYDESSLHLVSNRLRSLIHYLKQPELLPLRERAVDVLQKTVFDQITFETRSYKEHGEIKNLWNAIMHSPQHSMATFITTYGTSLRSFARELGKMLVVISECHGNYSNAAGISAYLGDKNEYERLLSKEKNGEEDQTNLNILSGKEEIVEKAVAEFVEKVKDDPSVKIEPIKEIAEIKEELKKLIN